MLQSKICMYLMIVIFSIMLLKTSLISLSSNNFTSSNHFKSQRRSILLVTKHLAPLLIWVLGGSLKQIVTTILLYTLLICIVSCCGIRLPVMDDVENKFLNLSYNNR